MRYLIKTEKGMGFAERPSKSDAWSVRINGRLVMQTYASVPELKREVRKMFPKAKFTRA